VARRLLAFSALLALAQLSACVRESAVDFSRAMDKDVTVGDQCAFTMPVRPDDCFEYAPCIYSDANIRLYRDDAGALHMFADSAGWVGGPPADTRVSDLSANQPAELAHAFPEMLRRLHENPPDPRDACVILNPDHSLSVGEIAAFHDALAAQRLRKIAFYVTLAEEP